ncbi:MAG: DUF6576 domain-containing protein [Planctomycetota bacterium]
MIRVHVTFLVYAAVRATQTLREDRAGLVFEMAAVLGLLAIVMLHEAASVAATALSGATSARATIWPLGRLDRHDPEQTAKYQIASITGGLLFGLLLMPVLAWSVRHLTGSWQLVFFSPFSIGASSAAAAAEGLAAFAVWSLYCANAIVVGLNLFVPMPPLAAGRLIDAVTQLRGGTPEHAQRRAGVVGLIAAGWLAALGLAAEQAVLVAAAAVGAFISWQEVSRSRLITTLTQDYEPKHAGSKPESTEEPMDQSDLDEILAKISGQGIESLSADERGRLERASRERRQR